MSLLAAYDALLKESQKRRKSLREGVPLFIPYPDTLKRFKKIMPGLIKEESWLITAQTGIGKSKFCRFLFINWPIVYSKINPAIKVSIIYNNLEETDKEVLSGMIIDYVKKKTGKLITNYQANGYEDVDEDVEKAIIGARDKIKELEPHLEITSISNPTGLYKKARELATKAGTFYKRGKKLTPEEVINGSGFDRYEDDPNHYLILLNDRQLLLQEERRNGKMMSFYETIMYWNDIYIRQILNKKLKFIVINIHQQVPDGESKQFTNKGQLIEERLEPSLDKLNKVKAVQQAITIAGGLFSPHKYQIPKRYEFHAPGYDIGKLGDCYREFIFFKHRKGHANKILPLFFDGGTETFEDMPLPDDVKGMNRIYAKVAEVKKNMEIDSQLTLDFDFLKNLDKID